MTRLRSLRLPVERFYAAVLDGAHLPRRRQAREEALSYAFEALLPEPLEGVHAIYRALPDGRYLAIALPKEVLRAEAGPDVGTLTPGALPAGLDLPVNPESLDLLTGAFTPQVVLRARRRRWIEVGLAGILGAFLLTVGFERRRLAALDVTAEARTAEAQRLDTALGPTRSALPSALRLQSELRTLRRTRTDTGVKATTSRDAALDLESLLCAWPAVEGLDVDSLVVSGTTWAIQGTALTSADPEHLATALAKHVKTEIPSVEARDTGAQFRLQGSFLPSKLP